MQLEQSAAQWAKFVLLEQARNMRRAAKAARTRGAQHLPIKPAAEFVSAAYDRVAASLERDAAAINPGE